MIILETVLYNYIIILANEQLGLLLRMLTPVLKLYTAKEVNFSLNFNLYLICIKIIFSVLNKHPKD
jgi:hypothetical protein